MDLALQLNFFATSAMFGVIWIVQLVHYPMFAGLQRDSFSAWHKYHSDRISYVVGPLMMIELGAALSLCWMRFDLWTASLLALTVLVWASTFFLSIPLHTSLGRQVENTQDAHDRLIRRLVLTNWFRTGLYTAKLVLILMWQV